MKNKKNKSEKNTGSLVSIFKKKRFFLPNKGIKLTLHLDL